MVQRKRAELLRVRQAAQSPDPKKAESCEAQAQSLNDQCKMSNILVPLSTPSARKSFYPSSDLTCEVSPTMYHLFSNPSSELCKAVE